MTELDRGAFGAGYDQANGILSNYNNRKAALQAGSEYAGGNVTGAAGILARNGQIDQARTLNSDAADQAAAAKKAKDEQASEAVTAMVHMASALKQIPDPSKRSEAFQRVIAPVLQQQGVDAAHIQQMGQSDFSDQTLDMTIAALGQEGKKYQLANGGDGYLGSFDPSSGKLNTLRDAQPQYQPVTVEDANGNKAVIPFNKANPYGTGATASQPAQAIPGDNGNAQGGTRADRNNNPGNLKWDGRSKWQGMVGVDPQGFVIFDTRDNGTRAAGINLQTQASRGPLTLRTLIAGTPGRPGYAPAADGNDPNAYAATVGQQIGIDPDAQINLNDPATRQKVMSAMFKVEGGGTPARVPSPPVDNGGLSPSNGMAPIYAAPGFGATTKSPEWIDLTAQERQQYQVPEGALAQKNVKTGKVDIGSGANAQQKADRQGQVALRKEFDGLQDVKNYNVVATSYNAIKKASQGKTAADDIALIYNFMRINDPSSVVREGEFATAQNAAGVPDRIRNAYNNALKGTRLNDSQRSQFVDTAKSLHEAQRERYDELVGQYQSYAQQSGYDPSQMFQTRANPDAQEKKGGGVNGYTPEQVAAHQVLKKQDPSWGTTQGFQLIPRTQAEYDRIKPGQHYLDTDGVVKEKR